MVKTKFNTFIRAANRIQIRLSYIKDQFLEVTDPSAVQVKTLDLLLAESKAKYEEFNAKLTVIEGADCDDYDEEAVNAVDQEISNLYINIQGYAATQWPSLAKEVNCANEKESNTPVLHEGYQPSAVKLPKISIPKFDGTLNNWMGFYNLFDTLVHQNSDLSNVEKLQFLLTSLEKEALNEVKAFPISNENYLLAWDRLTKRYHNKRRLISYHLNQILDLPAISGRCVQDIRSFISMFNQNAQALVPLGTDVHEESSLLVTMLLRKIDPETRRRFEHSGDFTQSMPSAIQLISFLENECMQIESANLTPVLQSGNGPSSVHLTKKLPYESRKPSAYSKESKNTLLSSYSLILKCPYCRNSGHRIYKCDTFMNLSVQDRYKFVKGNRYCSNCLGTTHTVKECKSNHTCSVCGRKHHSLLHFTHVEQTQSPTPQEVKPNLIPQTISTSTHTASPECFTALSRQSDQTIVLATTLVKVTTLEGKNVVLRGLLDSCAQATFISEHASRLLQLSRQVLKNSTVNGLSAQSVRTKGCAELSLQALNGFNISPSHPVIILDRITSNLPQVALSPQVRWKLKNLVLADPTFDKPGPIDILLGADIFSKVLSGETYHLGDNMPVAVNTVFGFVIMGSSLVFENSITNNESDNSLPVTLLSVNDRSLHESLQKFWSLEEPHFVPKMTKEEEDCETHYAKTTTRDHTGRYVVSLPFKDAPEKLGNSFCRAKSTFLSLEKRLSRDPALKTKYIDFMNDYLNSGHMKLCETPPDQSEPHYYLPHHGVFKGEKLRVVFNASSPTSNSVSLNQILHQGPKLQNDITDILFNFRRYAFVFTCDIRQMFRQITVNSQDKKFQLILWRDDQNTRLQTYHLTTVTYGMTSSPYLAIRTIQQLLDDEGELYPLASRAMKGQIYVDDILLGADTLNQALELQKDVINLLVKGGFELRKWSSNHSSLLENVCEDHREAPLSLSPQDQPLFSILGIKWLSNSDEFSYLVKLPSLISDHTKRTVLSSIARIYDPCGWISPVVFWAKMLIQRLWVLKIGWDEHLPDDLRNEWNRFLAELPAVEKIKMSRSLSISSGTSVQLLGFCDASESGFAACVYLRTECSNNPPNISLLVGKTKVAPLKRVSLPRLELCAAHLLSNLVNHYTKLLSPHVTIADVVLWCDSTIALSWIQTPPFRLKTYIANRVAQIQEVIQPTSWRHIRSQDNPADCASRGTFPSILLDHPLWWHGPPWLLNSPDLWPVSQFTGVSPENLPEVKIVDATGLLSSTEQDTSHNDLLSKFSNWNTLHRTLAYVLRFINNSRTAGSHRKKHKSLTIDELNMSTVKICLLVQRQCFAEEITSLIKNKPCGKHIERLSPFMDSQGLIRVGGRLRHSLLSEDQKHPIVLPKSHHVTNLIIDFYHTKHLHAGPRILQSLIVQKFWILSARSVIRSRIFKCVTCFKCKPKFSTPLMGDLPARRLTSTRVFETCGTDYAGPFNMKIHKLRRVQPIKVYLCVFICFAVKAVHIEVVSDLTSEAYIAALTRFVSRRGLPSHIYSDCGSNYVGASSAISKIWRKFFKDLSVKNSVEHFSTKNSIQFHFSPARAPNFGGLWERSVRSIKHHLRRVIGQQLLTLEEFSTLCCKIEAILNSRPLTPLSADPCEMDVLTPGHFLIGCPLSSIPEEDHQDIPLNRLRRWQLVQSFTQNIWKRWKAEYLHTLQTRTKWTNRQNPLRVGDLVIVHEDNLPPLSWTTARIEALCPGQDGIVRVVRLRTKCGTIVRPSSKVSVLPIY